LGGIDFAIPFRSNINHTHVFWTDKQNRCGVDFSKAVVIEDIKYIDAIGKPYIRPNEYKALIGRDRDLKHGLLNYIKKYKEAKSNPNRRRSANLLQYSTMQYFEEYINAI